MILHAVFFYVRYAVSSRDLEEILAERGVTVDHATLNRWVVKFARQIAAHAQTRKRSTAKSWRMDETYIKVSGRWRYLYRAIDREGNLLDSMLSEHRDKHAARRFLRRLIDSAGRKPLRMTTDKHPAYTKAIRWIVGRKVLHRHNQYLNNRMEQNHRGIKQRYYPMLGFKRFESASRFCTAFDELRNYLRVSATEGEHVPADVRRKIFTNKWSTLMTELSA